MVHVHFIGNHILIFTLRRRISPIRGGIFLNLGSAVTQLCCMRTESVVPLFYKPPFPTMVTCDSPLSRRFHTSLLPTPIEPARAESTDIGACSQLSPVWQSGILTNASYDNSSISHLVILFVNVDCAMKL
jgi:hypothetical protein